MTTVTLAAALALVVGLGTGCDGAFPPPRTGLLVQSEFVTVFALGAGSDRTLRLDPAPGARINALLPPVLTLNGGERFAFDNDSLTADSSYFIGHPTTVIGATTARRATLNASVCPAGLRVCLSVELPIALR